MLLPLCNREVSVTLWVLRGSLQISVFVRRGSQTEILSVEIAWVLPVQVCYKEAQSLVVGWRQLAEKVSDLENDPVELDARPSFLSRLSALRFISLLHNHSLTLFGQADDVVVVSIQDQWLW